MGVSPFQVVRDFESALCSYTGAPYAVTTNSCTMAILLAVKWHLLTWQPDTMNGEPSVEIEIPSRTYISVPMSIILAGGWPKFREEEWSGYYRLSPLPIFDSARWFTDKLYSILNRQMAGGIPLQALEKSPGTMVCCSFHASKTLGHSQGGAILHDNPEADVWLRKMRYDGRTEGVAPIDDAFTEIGFHCYLSPDVAAALLLKLHSLPRHNAPLKNDNYPDLSKLAIFR